VLSGAINGEGAAERSRSPSDGAQEEVERDHGKRERRDRRLQEWTRSARRNTIGEWHLRNHSRLRCR